MSEGWTQLTPEVVRDPDDWPETPFLIVERRGHERRGNPWCFLVATHGYVEPVVYMTNEWPPDSDFNRAATPRFRYENLMDLIDHGWTPYTVEVA